MWAAVSFQYKSRLHFCNSNLTAQRYRDDILIPYIAPMYAFIEILYYYEIMKGYRTGAFLMALSI